MLGFWSTLHGAQSLLLGLIQGSLLVGFGKHLGFGGNEYMLAVCRANALPTAVPVNLHAEKFLCDTVYKHVYRCTQQNFTDNKQQRN